MPREFVILSPRMPDDASFHAATLALSSPDLTPLSITLDAGGLLARFHTAEIDRVLTVLHPRVAASGDELDRLVPAHPPVSFVGDRWWTDAVAPWGPDGELGERLAAALAEALGGQLFALREP